MSTSDYRSNITFDPDAWDENAPKSPFFSRTLSNNVAHAMDLDAPVIAAYSYLPTPFTSIFESGPGTIAEPAHVQTFGPFPLRFRPSSASYHVQVRARAVCATPSDAGVLAIALHRATRGIPGARDAASIAIDDKINVTGLTPINAIAGDVTDTVTLVAEGKLRLTGGSFGGFDEVETLDRTTGETRTVLVALAALSVFYTATTSQSGDGVELRDFYARQYVGL